MNTENEAEQSAFFFMRVIASQDNPLFKKLLSLKRPFGAKKAHRVLIEGRRHISDIFRAGIVPDFLFFPDDEKGRALLDELCHAIDGCANMPTDQLILLSPPLFHKVTNQTTAQGVIAVSSLLDVTWDTWKKSIENKELPSRALLLESVQDPGNVGTLIRPADALGFDAVILLGDSASLYNPKTLQAAMGSEFHLPVVETGLAIDEILEQLKEQHFTTVGAALQGETPRGFHFGARVAIALGNEGQGLSDVARQTVDQLLSIPMTGEAESLNVATAGAILMWEAR